MSGNYIGNFTINQLSPVTTVSGTADLLLIAQQSGTSTSIYNIYNCTPQNLFNSLDALSANTGTFTSLTAVNANVTGAITANTGTFTSATIGTVTATVANAATISAGNGNITGAVTANTGTFTSTTIGTITATTANATTISAGTINLTGGQITFPVVQAVAAGSTVLDDYREGTDTSSWTPTISFDGGTSGITYSLQHGQFIKVGRLVTCFYNIVLTAKGTSTGAIRIGGFPFSSASTPSNVGGGVCDAYSNMTTTGVGALFTKVQANNTFATLRRGATGSGTSSITLTDADISATFTVGGTLTYIASQ